MLVCHCMKITDSQIIEKVRKGLGTIEALARECGITMGCGGCTSLVKKIIKEEKAQNKTMILAERIQPTRFERGCVHDIDYVEMSKIAEGTKMETKNQWVITCQFGPTWAWYNPTQTWVLFNGSVKWADFELPFEVAHKLLHSIKSKKQLEKENQTMGGITGQRPVVTSLRSINQQFGYLRNK